MNEALARKHETRIRRSRADDVARTIAIWRDAVLATHHFLSADDFAAIERIVAEQYLPTADLWIVAAEDDRAVGFMGMTEAKIDSLFVDPAHHRHGIGRKLIDHAASLHPVLTVDVNAQNSQAVAFYQRNGFIETGRSARDDDGRPYPLLHMRRQSL